MEKLIIYQKALGLVKECYLFANRNSDLYKDKALTDQFKRASVSVVLNIAEGYGRGCKSYSNYLRIAVGSTNEVIAVLDIIKLIYKLETEKLKNEYLILARQISAFNKTFK